MAGLLTKDASTGTESTTSREEEEERLVRPLLENRASSDRQSFRQSTRTLRRLRLIVVAPAVIPMAKALYGNKLAQMGFIYGKISRMKLYIARMRSCAEVCGPNPMNAIRRRAGSWISGRAFEITPPASMRDLTRAICSTMDPACAECCRKVLWIGANYACTYVRISVVCKS